METRKSYQIRALLRKSFTLQARQKGTNCCQVLTPILCLLLVYLMKSIAETQLEEHIVRPVQLESLPRFLNPPLVPNYALYELAGLGVGTCTQWYLYDVISHDNYTEQFVGKLNNSTASGLLGRIDSYYCQDNDVKNPFFVRAARSVNAELFSALEMIDKSPMRHHRSAYSVLLPDGAVTFYEARAGKLKYKVQINDNKFRSYHRNNGVTKLGIGGRDMLVVTDGLLSLIDMVHKALFSALFEDTHLVTMVQYMPVDIQGEAELMRLLNILGASLYPIALSLLLPVFMYAVVLEKEEKIQDFMKMNGMRISRYWAVSFLFNLGIFIVTVGAFYLFGYTVLGLQFFTQTNLWVLCAFFLGWGISQISLAFLIQVFISRARTATIWGYLLSIWTSLWGITLNVAIYPIPYTLPWYFLIYPHFALTRGIYLFSYHCGYWKCIETLEEVSPELADCILSLWGMGIVILIAALYLNQVVPREFGVPKHPLFCFRKHREVPVFNESELAESFTADLQGEDRAVKEEREKVLSLSPPYTHPLVVKNLTKVYKGVGGKPAKVAVNKMSLHIAEGEVFGLLGPNGAGKTTLISMLTGLYKPDGGSAWVSGFDIRDQLEDVQLYMGVCPQFDILWPELTVKEHLLFYARLKGSAPDVEEQAVSSAMRDVFLTSFAHLKASQLSGGMRRRLSVAIALVGSPKIIFLDEPTTGLDPENRRQLWDILAKCKADKAMVLTTHSMEEADVLCNRLAIVSQGVLRCIGPQAVLKALYGGGYHLFVNVRKMDSFEEAGRVLEEVKDFVRKKLPEAVLTSEFHGNLVYQVPVASCRVSYVFKEFEGNKEAVGIADWGISQSSLEDVFLRVVKSNEVDEFL